MQRGRKKKEESAQPYSLPFTPVLLKELTMACGIVQQELADGAGKILGRSISRATANLTINRGYIPPTIDGYRQAVETVISGHHRASLWLAERRLDVGEIWDIAEQSHRNEMPSGHAQRSRAGTMAAQKQARNALRPGNPTDMNEEEKQMKKIKIPEQVLKHFKLFRDPFQEDPRSDKEVFRSDEHRYIEYAMLDAAQNAGFLAVIGEVGSGKSVMRRAVIDQLRRDDRVRIIYPQIIDKTRITSDSLCDAIVMDLSHERPKVKLEGKARHVQKLLVDRATAGYKVCIIIEEAHDLTVPVLKYLKRFNELELGFQKLLGVIILGQVELANTLDEAQNPDMREVIRRIQIATITGLNGSTYQYLDHKFRIVGGDIERIITREAIDSLSRRLTIAGERGKKVSQAYPLTVNNYVASAMMLSIEMGEDRITPDVVDAL